MALLLLISAVLAVGCGRDGEGRSGTGARVSATPRDPEFEAYERIRSGMVQLGGAASSVEEALGAVEGEMRNAPVDLKDALLDVKDLIDDAGAGIAEYAVDPPTQEDYRSNPGKWARERDDAGVAARESLVSLKEALGQLNSLVEEARGEQMRRLDEVAALVEVAIQDTREAIESFGLDPDAPEI
jgi:hypothetical protein